MPELSADLALPDGLTREYLLHHQVCPLGWAEPGTLRVAVSPDALVPEALDDLALAYGSAVVAEPASAEVVERLIERLATRAEPALELAPAAALEADDERTADVRELATQPPVVRYVNLLVREAYAAGASDIHLEATRAGLVVRMRIDGVLGPAPTPPAGLGHAVVSRIKLLAELDIAERRRPQDGRIRVRLDSRTLDLRVATVPTLHGESVVLRLLDVGGRPVALGELGMPDPILAHVERLAQRPHGLLVVTGPTGAGKTTTLYAALRRRPAASEKLITVEEPVEYELPGVTQVPVERAAGVTFASALRALLRQDPDVLMVGEMRDGETAELAVQAALTGHVVFSTLHTNDALGAIPRLLDLGVPAYLVAATLAGVLGQRLVRRVCAGCRTRYTPSADECALLAARSGKSLGDEGLVRGAGCAACRGTGYRGRVGLFELVVVSEALQAAVARGAPAGELDVLARAAGWEPLEMDGWRKVAAGLTTVEEVLRVIQA
jgi:general secretion pathway protein E